MLRFILEAYEGIGLITTLDAALGLIEMSIAPGCDEDVAQILSGEENNLHLRPVCLGNSDQLPTAGDQEGGNNG